MNCCIRAAWLLLPVLPERPLRLLPPKPDGRLAPAPVLTLALGNKAETACWMADELVFSRVTIFTVRLASMAASSSVATRFSTCLNSESLAETIRALVRLSTPRVILTPLRPPLLPPRLLPPPPPINIANGFELLPPRLPPRLLPPRLLPPPPERPLEASSSL